MLLKMKKVKTIKKIKQTNKIKCSKCGFKRDFSPIEPYNRDSPLFCPVCKEYQRIVWEIMLKVFKKEWKNRQ